VPKKRQPIAVWQKTRERIWLRDGGMCQYPYGEHTIRLEEANIDHIKSGKLSGNEDSNLRVLCRYHHVLRIDHRHRGMIASALQDGIIPANWRELMWE